MPDTNKIVIVNGPNAPNIRKNAWDNWYGYIGNRKVAYFFSTPWESQEEQARKWLEAQKKKETQ